MQIRECPPPRAYKHFQAVRAFDLAPEGREDFAAFCAWTDAHMPRLVKGGPVQWNWESYPYARGAYTMRAFFATDELAERFLGFWNEPSPDAALPGPR